MPRTQLLHLFRLALFALFVGGAVSAAEAAESSQREMRLSRFSTTQGPVRLTDVSSSVDLFVPVSPLASMKDAAIEIRFSHSIALQERRSYLLVRLNDISLAQVPFDPKQPVASARIRLPDDLWRSGFNKLTLAVIQHYIDNCEDGNAPELWTELKLHESNLEFSLDTDERPLTLRDIAGVFAPGLGGSERALLMTSSGPEADAVVADALPLLAQALALRRQFAPLQFDYARWPAQANDTALGGASYLPPEFAGKPHVLVGTFEQLGAIIPGMLPEAVTGPHLSIDRSESISDAQGSVIVPSSVRIIVSGRNATEVKEAAAALAAMDDPLNPIAETNILAQTLTPETLAPYHARVLHSGQAYTFAAMGLATRRFQGFGGHGAQLRIMMPPDYYTHDSAQAELFIDFGYGAGMGPGSVINFKLNGDFIHGRLLDDPHGTSFRGYRIVLPARRLMPGPNLLDIDLMLRPETVIGECAGIDGRHLTAQILGSSRLVLPEFGAVATQPNLDLFGTTAFPYLATTREQRATLIAGSESEVGSALTLIGKLAQVASTAHDAWHLKVGLPGGSIEGSAVVVASAAQLPDDLFDAWSIAIGRSVRWPYQALNDVREAQATPERSILDMLIRHFRSDSATTNRVPVLRGSVTQSAGLGPLGALTAFRNPRSSTAATLTLITAADADLVQARVADLVKPELWSQVDGDLMVWENVDDPVFTLRVANTFETGSQDPWLLLRLVLSNSPWYWLGAALAAALLIVITARALLNRRRRRLEDRAGRAPADA